jgi:hypothetical protein
MFLYNLENYVQENKHIQDRTITQNDEKYAYFGRFHQFVL